MIYVRSVKIEGFMASDIQPWVRTLRLKVKREGYAWLNAAAIEVNQVWNFSNATCTTP
jgi:hypothetical protein